MKNKPTHLPLILFPILFLTNIVGCKKSEFKFQNLDFAATRFVEIEIPKTYMPYRYEANLGKQTLTYIPIDSADYINKTTFNKMVQLMNADGYILDVHKDYRALGHRFDATLLLTQSRVHHAILLYKTKGQYQDRPLDSSLQSLYTDLEFFKLPNQ